MNFVPCVAWVSRGKAESNPHKLQLSAEELKCLVKETKELCKQNNIEESDEEDSTETDQEEDSENLKQEADISDSEENDDFDKRYNLDTYDTEDGQNPLFTINDIALHVDNRDDEYLTDQESVGDIEEKEDFVIKNSDNLLVVGHVEDSSSVLEIHVYNQEEDSFYVHHDIVLPSYPLALTWLDFHPSDEKAGNYIAVGDMSPVIKIWDLDVVDVLEPDYTLGKISKKKKEKLLKKAEMKYHTDAVLSLGWNKLVRNLLASGSADYTVIVWDLEEGTSLNQLSFHSNKVQALEWHPSESQFLLSGCTDGFLKLYDCRSTDEAKSWKVNGEIERVIWNIDDSLKFLCSTDQGYIHSIDMRKCEIEYSFMAHKEAVTGLDISPIKPNLLVSASMDKTLKVWDLKNNFNLIKSMKMKVGSIYTAKVAPDLDLTVAVGGNYESNNLKVVNLLGENKDKSDENSEGIKMEHDNEFQTKKKINKRIIYDKSDENSGGIKMEHDNEFQAKNKTNKRIIYDKSDENSEGIKMEHGNEFQAKNKTNKRIIYDTEESTETSHQESKSVTFNKKQKHFKTEK